MNNGIPIRGFRTLKHYTIPYKGELALSLKYSNSHAFTLNALKWMDNTQHQTNILAAEHLQKWAERKDSLWWSCLSHMDVGKRTVRSHHARRVRQCFVESLRKQGYASDGSRLPGSEEKPPLFGTVMLGANLPILKTKSDVLAKQTDRVVERLIFLTAPRRPPQNPDRSKVDGRFSIDRRPSQGGGPKTGSFSIRRA